MGQAAYTSSAHLSNTRVPLQHCFLRCHGISPSLRAIFDKMFLTSPSSFRTPLRRRSSTASTTRHMVTKAESGVRLLPLGRNPFKSKARMARPQHLSLHSVFNLIN